MLSPNFDICQNLAVFQAILSRRDCRQFENKVISKTVLQNLLYAASWAPNHKLTEPWRFWVIESKNEFIEVMAQGFKKLGNHKKAQKIQDTFYQIPLFMAIAYQKEDDSILSQENLITTSCAIQNLLLAAQEQGIYAHWSSGEILNVLSAFLQVPDNQELIALLHMGYANPNTSKMKRTSVKKFVQWV